MGRSVTTAMGAFLLPLLLLATAEETAGGFRSVPPLYGGLTTGLLLLLPFLPEGGEAFTAVAAEGDALTAAEGELATLMRGAAGKLRPPRWWYWYMMSGVLKPE